MGHTSSCACVEFKCYRHIHLDKYPYGGYFSINANISSASNFLLVFFLVVLNLDNNVSRLLQLYIEISFSFFFEIILGKILLELFLKVIAALLQQYYTFLITKTFLKSSYYLSYSYFN